MKVLVIRFSSIGDIVLTTPVVRVLKSQLGAEVHYFTKKGYTSLLENNPYIDKVWGLEDSLSSVLDALKKEQFDYIIDLHNNLRTRIVKWKLGVQNYSFDKLNWQKWIMVRFKINRLPNKHIVDRYLETLKPLGGKEDALGLDYFIPEKDEVPIDWLPETHQKGYLVYAIGGQHDTKKLPLSRMIELCDKMNRSIVLIGGKEDLENGQQIAQVFEKRLENAPYEEGLQQLGKKTIIFNGCGKFNLNQSASIIRQSMAVFTHDTGMMHVAAAFKKQVYSIWGNTIPEFGMYPYKTQFTVFERQNLSCRPCSKIGYNKCPKGHFDCMNKISFDFYMP